MRRSRALQSKTGPFPAGRWGLFALLLGALVLWGSLGSATTQGLDSVAAAPVPLAADPTLDTCHYALPSFVSPLPLLVLEIPEGPATEAEDFFLEATLLSFEGQAANRLQDVPAHSEKATLRNLTEKTHSDPQKDDYYLALEAGQTLLDLDATGGLLLLGGAKDKSLIRNSVGYTLGARLFGLPPASRLCEVFFRTEEGDLYQGVYLLAAIPPHQDAVLFHRDTVESGISVNTYATENDPASGYVNIPVMESAQWDDRLSPSIGRLSLAESVLYSTDSATFYTYPTMFDVPSFIANYILGEVTENYAGMASAYYYHDLGTNRISAAPIWNFEEAFDNQARGPVDTKKIRYEEAPYYRLFFKSPQFAQEVQRRYVQLRRDYLNENALAQLVNEAADLVAPAAKRDWSRWDDYKHHQLSPRIAPTPDGDAHETAPPFQRQTATHAQEILRLRFELREHNLNMALDLTQFDFSEREISKEIVLNSNPLWVLLFLVVFFLLVRFARRYGA